MTFREAGLQLACVLAWAITPALADNPGSCSNGDSDCFERNQVAACHDRPAATIEACGAWIRALENQAANGSSDAELSLAQAYAALAANLLTDPAVRAEYEARARSIYRARIRRDADDAQALLALATLVDDENEKIDLLKRGIAWGPDEVYATRWLASLLHERNEPSDALEAANYVEEAYDAMKPERWVHHASSTYWYYQQAGAEDEAARFRTRVIDDWGARELTDVTTNNAPEDVEQTLQMVCDSYATGVLGMEMCGRSIATVMRYLSSADVTPRTQALADAAARAMEDSGRDGWTLECEPPESQATFESELDTLLALGFESAPVQSAFARVAPCGERLHALQRAVHLAPQDGELAWRLGGAYASDGRWNEALATYRRAKSLPTVVPKYAIDEQIRIIEERISVQVRKIDDRTTEVSGTFRAAPDILFGALTQSEHQKRWMSGDGFTLTDAEVDGRAGGGFRYVYARPSGKLIEVRGKYSVFDPPRGFAYVETYDFSPLEIDVTVKLQGLGDETRYTQTLLYATVQERDEDFDGVARSSKDALAKLTRYIANAPPGR